MMNSVGVYLLFCARVLLLSSFPNAQAKFTDIFYNGFYNTNLSLSGIARIDSGVLQLTNVTSRLIGRAFHPTPVVFEENKSFSTTFVFSITPHYPDLGGHGLAFVLCASPELKGALPSQYLGLLSSADNNKSSNHLFAVEFDTVQDFEFGDINDNHVGINVNSMASRAAATVALKTGPKRADTQELSLKSGENIHTWITYNGSTTTVSVWMAPVGTTRPVWPLLQSRVNISEMFTGKPVYVGFSASTGLLSSVHHIVGWSFSASSSSSARDLDISHLPSIPSSTRSHFHTTVALVTAASLMVVLIAASFVIWKVIRGHEKIEEWELQCGPHRFTYRELSIATRGFRDQQLLGFGGFGRVYKGTLPSTGAEVAVKRVSHDSKQGLREFVAEISSIGRLRHRNLVQLLGWCRLKGEFLLVYDYMPYGSLDKFLFDADPLKPMLAWTQRYAILQGVASALLYLHEEWEQCVLHRDVKASNVLLDSDLNARLGDFGLARLYEHGMNPHTTKVVGTLGYLAPELTRTGKATTSSDVYSFGALLLEVATGRRPIETRVDELVLVDWVWDMHSRGRVLDTVDPNLRGDFDSAQALRVLRLGLVCLHPLPHQRPTMRNVMQILNDDVEVPAVPSQPPAAITEASLPLRPMFSSASRERGVSSSTDFGSPPPPVSPVSSNEAVHVPHSGSRKLADNRSGA